MGGAGLHTVSDCSAYCYCGMCPPTPQINNSKVCAGKARMDTKNYNTNSRLGIYTPASLRIYDAVCKRADKRGRGERGRETNNTRKSD